MKISNLKPGMRLYSVEHRKIGNTTRKTAEVYLVLIDYVDEDSFTASWNSNPYKEYTRVPSNWSTRKPYMIPIGFGLRKATAEEKRTLEWVEKPYWKEPKRNDGV